MHVLFSFSELSTPFLKNASYKLQLSKELKNCTGNLLGAAVLRLWIKNGQMLHGSITPEPLGMSRYWCIYYKMYQHVIYQTLFQYHTSKQKHKNTHTHTWYWGHNLKAKKTWVNYALNRNCSKWQDLQKYTLHTNRKEYTTKHKTCPKSNQKRQINKQTNKWNKNTK